MGYRVFLNPEATQDIIPGLFRRKLVPEDILLDEMNQAKQDLAANEKELDRMQAVKAQSKINFDQERRLEEAVELVKNNLSSASMDDMKTILDRFDIQIIPEKDSIKISGVLASFLSHHCTNIGMFVPL